MASDINRKIVAGLFIGAGFILLLVNLDFIELDIRSYLFRWYSILLVIGFLVYFKNDNRNGIIMIAIGGFFLMSSILSDLFYFHLEIWPLLLITAGVLIIYQSKKTDDFDSSSGQNGLSEIAFFGGNNLNANTVFKRGSQTSIFGGSTIDLRKSQLTKGTNELQVFVLFGGIKLMLPQEVKAEFKMSPVLGEIVDKRRTKHDGDTDKVLNIKGSIIFGGGEIVN